MEVIYFYYFFYAQYAERNMLMHLTSIRDVGISHPGKISQSMFLVTFFSFFFLAYSGGVNNYV